jgi:two-component system CheB/CheR fusion protein
VGVDIRLDAPEHHLRADPARMHQVFWNLLNNACKFTPPGGTISVRSRNPGTGSAPSIVLEVADTGVGIEPELLPRLFTAFEQGESPRARRAGGLGLGLAISKALVEAHGGTLTAQSDGPGRGAIFLVQLPVSLSQVLPAGSANGQPTAAGAARSLRILLVEDHPATLVAMKRLLGTMGHRVVTATTVAGAVDAAGQETFELIISDLGLPDGLGYDIMQIVSGKGAIRGIALSGYGMPADIERSRVSGFSEHLIKPVDLEVLEAAISRVTSEKS